MEIKKNPKADLNRWSSVFFLVGLVVMLFASWRLLEWKSFDQKQIVQEMEMVSDDLESDIPITQQINTPPPPPPPPMAALPQVINVADDSEDIEETVFESSETDQNQEIVEIESIEEVEEEEEIPFVPFAVIEDVPIYPGCESKTDNASRKECMSDQIMQYVQTNFNVDLATELGLEGRQRINVQFMIDANGCVINVRARAPHPMLEDEAVRVVKSLPNMKPGMQRGRPVGVMYALPILFVVETTG
ncbi:MAG: energy transducer TonB [Flavobacteriaceae bacterium]|nr:energy transducer TonB [Flavobacteriaceae bacterium]